MGLNFDNPVIERGDSGAALSDWRFAGVVTDSNTDRGRLFCRLEAGNLELAVDRGFVTIVASGPDPAADGDAVLAPVGGSGLTATVYRTVSGDISAGQVIILYVYLCDEQDLRESDELVTGLLIANEVRFDVLLRKTMREFLTRMGSIFPPPPSIGHPLRWEPPVVEHGSRGDQPWMAQFFWGLNYKGSWEVVGLQNPDDYREWAIQQTLAFGYERKARAGDASDPMFSRFVSKQRQADVLFATIKPWVDVDRDLLPDRQPKIRSQRIRRG